MDLSIETARGENDHSDVSASTNLSEVSSGSTSTSASSENTSSTTSEVTTNETSSISNTSVVSTARSENSTDTSDQSSSDSDSSSASGQLSTNTDATNTAKECSLRTALPSESNNALTAVSCEFDLITAMSELSTARSGVSLVERATDNSAVKAEPAQSDDLVTAILNDA